MRSLVFKLLFVQMIFSNMSWTKQHLEGKHMLRAHLHGLISPMAFEMVWTHQEPLKRSDLAKNF